MSSMESKTESKYERLRKIGIGSYGVVFKCVNRKTGQIVAIKRYSENDSDPVIKKIAMREVRMLRQLKHPNLIYLIEVFRRKRRLHLVFDYCELTVLDVIEKYSNNCPPNLIKKIIWQTVNGVNYCHTHNCIHRDIKPENILINQSGVVKLCDFGFARNITTCVSNDRPNRNRENIIENSKNYNLAMRSYKLEQKSDRQALTEYVATRWYRAPELLIGEVHYDIKIDIWAIGCVTAELMRGDPIWPGKTDYDQLSMIISSLGRLTQKQTQTLVSQNIYEQNFIENLLTRGANPSESIERKLPLEKIGDDGLDFVISCLKMDPQKRPSSDELLSHEYTHSVKMIQFVQKVSRSSIPSRDSKTHALHRNKPQTGVLISTPQSNSQSLMMATRNRSNSKDLATIKTSTKPVESRRHKMTMRTVDESGSASPSIKSRNSSIPVSTSTPSLSSANSGTLMILPIEQQKIPARKNLSDYKNVFADTRRDLRFQQIPEKKNTEKITHNQKRSQKPIVYHSLIPIARSTEVISAPKTSPNTYHKNNNAGSSSLNSKLQLSGQEITKKTIKTLPQDAGFSEVSGETIGVSNKRQLTSKRAKNIIKTSDPPTSGQISKKGFVDIEDHNLVVKVPRTRVES